MRQPHKHAELIKAWADGAEIEYRNSCTRWLATKTPTWLPDYEYRIKPEPNVMYVNVYKNGIWSAYQSREAAIAGGTDKRVACIRVTYTEGQFDE